MKRNLKSTLLLLVLLMSCFALFARPSKLLAKIPFELNNGAIILSVKINNSPRVLKLLFDTGADGMALRQDLADSIGLKESRKQNTSVVGGSMQISVSEGNAVHIGDFDLSNQSIAFFKEMGKGSDGIIGNVIAKHYITKVDFDKKELLLYSFGEYNYDDKGVSVPVNVSGVFIIPGSIAIVADKLYTGNFVFDTGASYSLICFRPFVKQNRLLVGGFKPEYNGSTISMGISTPTFTGKASSFSFANMLPISNLPVTLMAGGGQAENWSPGVDGSIGIRLISRYNFTINAAKKEIHFLPNNSYVYPNDFMLGGYLFGFDTTGALHMLSKVVYGNQSADIAVGVTIQSINGINYQTLLKDQKKLKQLTELPVETIINIEYLENGKKQTASLPRA